MEKNELKIQVDNLITLYEQKAECGIFFKLSPDKSPLEILGVLNFLKDRIKKWGNISLFSYDGPLFSRDNILVVGSRNLEEAISIIIYMYLFNVVDNHYEKDIFLEKLGASFNLEISLRNKISGDIRKGYPINPSLESELLSHLNSIIRNSTD